MEALEFLATFPIWTVILIVVATMICLFKLVEWGKRLWATREKFKKAQQQVGQQQQQAIDHELEEKQKEEKRIAALETAVTTLTAMLAKQQQQIDLLIRSDELDIKAWIQQQHEKWIAFQYIDSQSLDLVLQRYAIYAEEGGNGWAERMVDDIKSLPIVTVIPVQPRE